MLPPVNARPLAALADLSAPFTADRRSAQLLVRHPAVNEHPEMIKALVKGTLTLRGLRSR